MFIKIFRRISDEDIAFMGFSPVWSRPEWMICQVLAVPPPSVRPSVKYDSSQRSEDDLTYILIQIIKANNSLKEKLAHDATPSSIDDYHNYLQFFVATLIDNKIPNAKPAAQRSGRAFKSIKDRLNGKAGRVRGNLMGKRVDFSARSVITPDPNLSIRELGVPLKIAQSITKPVMVNRRNIHSLSTLVLNGPDVYPGAKLLERKVNDRTVHISLKYADRESIQLEFSVPIMDWGRSKSRTATAKANLQLAQQTVAQDKMSFEQEVFTQVTLMGMLQQQVSLTARADEIAALRFKIAQDRFLLSDLSITDLSIAIQEKDRAKRDYILALRDYWRAYYTLRLLTLYDFEQNRKIA
jgi:DNA-directed RNA polymerase beta' subunit